MTAEQRQLVERNLKLAYYLAAKFRHYRLHGASQEDLEQVAMLALVEAASRFDQDKGSFSTFAGRITVQRLLVFVSHHCSVVPWGLDGTKCGARLRVASGRDKSPQAELLRQSRYGVELTESCMVTRQTPEDEVAKAELVVAVREALAGCKLRDRERAILERRVLAEEPELLHELAAEWGVTRQCVHQAEKVLFAKAAQALSKLAA